MALSNEQVKDFLMAEGLNVEDAASCNRTYNKMLEVVKKAKDTDPNLGKFVRSMFTSESKESKNGKKKFWTYFPKYKTWTETLDAYTNSTK